MSLDMKIGSRHRQTQGPAARFGYRFDNPRPDRDNLPKAKEVQKLADKMVTLGKINTLSSRIRAAKIIRFEYVDENKQQFALQKLFNDIAPNYRDRDGGYTRVLKLGTRRGDAAPMAIIEFV